MKHKSLNFIKLSLASLTLSLCPVVYGTGGPHSELDCENKNDANCDWPNVGVMSAFADIDGNDVGVGRCSMSLLHKDDTKFVILTGGHCNGIFALYPLLGLTFKDYGVSFDPVLNLPEQNSDPSVIPKFIRGGYPIYNPAFFDWLTQKGFSTLGSQNELDVGVISFPIDATNGDGLTIDDLYPNIEPVKVIGNDTNTSVADIAKSAGRGIKAEKLVTQVGYGTTDIAREGKPYTDVSTFGQRRVGPMTIQRVRETSIYWYQQDMQGNVIASGGDSGSPQFFEVDGEPVQISVFSFGQSLWGNNANAGTVPSPIAGSFRLDHPDAIALVNCVRNAQGDTYQEQVDDMQECINAIR